MKSNIETLKQYNLTTEEVRKALTDIGVRIQTDEKEEEFVLIDHLGNSITKAPFDYTPENVEIAMRCFYLGMLSTIVSVVMLDNEQTIQGGPLAEIYDDVRAFTIFRFMNKNAFDDMKEMLKINLPKIVEKNNEELFYPDREKYVPAEGEVNVEEEFNKTGNQIAMGQVHLKKKLEEYPPHGPGSM